MTYEEQKQVRIQISQMLADAGINQKTIKEMVRQEIENKVDREFDRCLKGCIEEERQEMSRKADAEIQRFFKHGKIDDVVKRALMDKVINVTLEGCSVTPANTDGNKEQQTRDELYSVF